MSRIKSSVKMGQGRRRRGGHACCGWPAAGAAGQIEIAAVTPRRTCSAWAAPGWPPVCKGVRWPAPARGAIPAEMEGVHDRAGRGGRGTAAARDRDCPALAGLGRRRAIRGGRGTSAARHPRVPQSGRPRSTARPPRGLGDRRCLAPAGSPLKREGR